MKRALKKMPRVLVIFMISALCFTGCVKKTDLKFLSPEYKSGAVVTDLKEQWKNGAYKASEADYAFLNGMTLALENESLSLYTGKYYDIAVLDKDTGSVFFSNKAIYDTEIALSDNQRAAEYSQVTLEYYDKSNHMVTANSFPDCVDDNGKNQVSMQVSGDTLEVNYKFGNKSSDRTFCIAFTAESFEKLSKIAEEKIAEGVLDSFDFNRFTETYEHAVFDELSEAEKKNYLKFYPEIKNLGELYISKWWYITNVQKDLVSEISKLLGINNQFIKEEMKKIGSSVTEGAFEEPYFEIPVVYSLSGRDLLVSVNSKKIVNQKGFYLNRFYVLPAFFEVGAEETGYLFVPDGSGAIINCNQTDSIQSSLDISFYGTDFGIETEKISSLKPYSSMPVFGIKNGDRAVFAIAENGDGMGGVTSQIINSASAYNKASPWFTYYPQDKLSLNGMVTSETNFAYVYPKKAPQNIYSLRYHFLYGDTADYSGMAVYYQKYLTETGVLKKRQNNQSLKLDINLIGAITKKQWFFGLPINKTVAATDYSGALRLTEELKKSGICDYNLIYCGAVNGGYDCYAPMSIKLEKALGTKKEFHALKSFTEQDKNTLFLNIDITKVYKKGNGLNKNLQVSRYINKKFANIAGFSSVDNAKETEDAAFLINPASYSLIIDRFTDDLEHLKQKSIFVSSLGSYLSGNYDEKYGVSREESKTLAEDALRKLKDKGYKIATDGGNLYTLRYADSVTGIPVSASLYAIESESVPFVGMVLYGFAEYSGPVLNQQGDYKTALLKCIESGAGLNYLLMTGDSKLFENTSYSRFYSVSSEVWLSRIVESYKELNQLFQKMGGSTMIKHEKLSDNVYKTTYSNNTSIILNYNEQPFVMGTEKIDGLSYKVV